MKQKYSKKRRFGNKGEDIAVRFLMKQEFNIIQRNYLKRIGEIDIIAEKDRIIHFIEVKSVSRETSSDVNHETNGNYRAEESVSSDKLLHMKRVIELFVMENDLYDANFQIDLITVTFFKSRELPRINFIDNIII